MSNDYDNFIRNLNKDIKISEDLRQKKTSDKKGFDDFMKKLYEDIEIKKKYGKERK